jgi:LPS O-antigen subunit length determinant protein (WzzB/FepE family)
MKKRIKSDEIDLIEVIVNILNNKLKIVAITAIFIIISVGLYFINKPPLNAKTEILPITIFENNLYSQYNSLIMPQGGEEDKKVIFQSGLNVINREYLFSLFLEELRTKDVIIEAIKRYQLIDQKKFDSKDEYLEAVEKKALKLDLLRPINVDGSERGETRLNWIIEFEVDDEDQWEEALSFIEIEINKNIKNYLKLNFDTTLDNLKLLDRFKLEDLNLNITNEKKDFDKKMKKFEMDLEFNLVDIKVKIKNAINDYEVETKNRLAFLTEQAAIARTLDIKKNTIESQEFSTQNSVITNVKTDTPYYLRGYEAIEKDIQLIKNRTDKKPFVKGLLDLEKQKRDLEEDKTLERAEKNKVFLEKILALNNAKRNLLEDKLLDRAEKLFNNTPIVSSNDFKAANIIYQDTEFEASFSLIKTILISGIFGVIFGIFYILISNAIRQRI